MDKLRWFLIGAGTICTLFGIAAGISLRNADGFSARAKPTAIEAWIARSARKVSLLAAARDRINPVLNDFVTLVEARAHWADHCAGCHANDGSGNTTMGRGTYPPAPDMRLPATQQLTDGELFYIIENGVRMTAMPAWGSNDHDSQDSWKLVYFIRHLPFLTKEETMEMEKLNPKSAAQLKEEQDEERFLRGENVDEPTHQNHH